MSLFDFLRIGERILSGGMSVPGEFDHIDEIDTALKCWYSSSDKPILAEICRADTKMAEEEKPDETYEPEPINVPIEDVLDLHTFRPKDIPDLLEDYFLACLESDIVSVRIIHGKGKGILRKRVHALLKKSDLVQSFRNAPPEAGSWGATLVELKEKKK